MKSYCSTITSLQNHSRWRDGWMDGKLDMNGPNSCSCGVENKTIAPVSHVFTVRIGIDPK